MNGACLSPAPPLHPPPVLFLFSFIITCGRLNKWNSKWKKYHNWTYINIRLLRDSNYCFWKLFSRWCCDFLQFELTACWINIFSNEIELQCGTGRRSECRWNCGSIPGMFPNFCIAIFKFSIALPKFCIFLRAPSCCCGAFFLLVVALHGNKIQHNSQIVVEIFDRLWLQKKMQFAMFCNELYNYLMQLLFDWLS